MDGNRVDKVRHADAGIHVQSPGGLSEIAQAAVALENLDLSNDITLMRIGGVERPMTVNEKPLIDGNSSVLSYGVQAKPDSKL